MPRADGERGFAMIRKAISVLAWLLPIGCSVAEVEPSPDPKAVNRCTASNTCNGGVCNGDNLCVASLTELTDLMIEVVRPPSSGGGGVPFYRSFPKLPNRGGRLDLEVPPLASVNGRVMIAPSELTCAEAACPCKHKFIGATADDELMPASDGSIPVDALFTPSERVLGMDAPTYSARFQISAGDDDVPEGSFVFPITIPPGNYDVYLMPRTGGKVELGDAGEDGEDDDGPCTPPLLIVNQPVSAGGRLDVILPPPQKLKITVRWPENNIKGSIVDLLDPVSGRVISTASALQEPSLSQSMSSVGYVSSVEVWYLPVYTPDADGKFKPTGTAGTEIVRLTPPGDRDRPTIFAARDPTNAMGELAQTGALPNDVIVAGLALVAGETTPVEAAVTLTAETLDGFDGGVLASFTRTVQVGPDGHFQVNVPPGTYRVEAVPKGGSAACDNAAPSPNAPCFAAVYTTWEIPRQTVTAPGGGGMGPLVQGGKVVEFTRAAVVSGRAATPLGPLAGASVRASVTPFSVQTDLLDRAAGRADQLPRLPRAGAALVNPDGYFSFLADSGTYDLFVQPDPASGFGWYVRPLLEVDSADQDLRNVAVPLPVVFQGTVTSPTGTYNVADGVSDALIRAYSYVPNPDRPAERAAIQVAEARSDRYGNFKLLIPAKLETGAGKR